MNLEPMIDKAQQFQPVRRPSRRTPWGFAHDQTASDSKKWGRTLGHDGRWPKGTTHHGISGPAQRGEVTELLRAPAPNFGVDAQAADCVNQELAALGAAVHKEQVKLGPFSRKDEARDAAA